MKIINFGDSPEAIINFAKSPEVVNADDISLGGGSIVIGGANTTSVVVNDAQFSKLSLLQESSFADNTDDISLGGGSIVIGGANTTSVVDNGAQFSKLSLLPQSNFAINADDISLGSGGSIVFDWTNGGIDVETSAYVTKTITTDNNNFTGADWVIGGANTTSVVVNDAQFRDIEGYENWVNEIMGRNKPENKDVFPDISNHLEQNSDVPTIKVEPGRTVNLGREGDKTNLSNGADDFIRINKPTIITNGDLTYLFTPSQDPVSVTSSEYSLDVQPLGEETESLALHVE